MSDPNTPKLEFTLSEEEKNQIIQRVEFEKQLRQESKPAPKKSVWSTLNSGLGLLLLTTVLSAVIVPQFQAAWQTRDWRLKTRAENVKFKLGKMRDGLQLVTGLNSSTSRGVAIAQRLTSPLQLTPAEYGTYISTIASLDQERFKGAADVRAFSVYFPGSTKIQGALTDYMHDTADYFEALNTYANVRRALFSLKGDEASQMQSRLDNTAKKLGDDSIKAIDSDYNKLLEAANTDIQQTETQYEKLDF